MPPSVMPGSAAQRRSACYPRDSIWILSWLICLPNRSRGFTIRRRTSFMWPTGSPLADQKMVMAHELTHALQDQHFQIEDWVKAARPNDDAELARESVLEGSAMAAMVDYLLQGTGRSLQDLPDIDPSMLIGDMESTPMLKKAPPFLKDALIFPYLDGLNFSAAVLRPDGWSALSGMFAKPPVSTQQILHPGVVQVGENTTQGDGAFDG